MTECIIFLCKREIIESMFMFMRKLRKETKQQMLTMGKRWEMSSYRGAIEGNSDIFMITAF